MTALLDVETGPIPASTGNTAGFAAGQARRPAPTENGPFQSTHPSLRGDVDGDGAGTDPLDPDTGEARAAHHGSQRIAVGEGGHG